MINKQLRTPEDRQHIDSLRAQLPYAKKIFDLFDHYDCGTTLRNDEELSTVYLDIEGAYLALSVHRRIRSEDDDYVEHLTVTPDNVDVGYDLLRDFMDHS